jgi:hypothetical protein
MRGTTHVYEFTDDHGKVLYAGYGPHGSWHAHWHRRGAIGGRFGEWLRSQESPPEPNWDTLPSIGLPWRFARALAQWRRQQIVTVRGTARRLGIGRRAAASLLKKSNRA